MKSFLKAIDAKKGIHYFVYSESIGDYLRCEFLTNGMGLFLNLVFFRTLTGFQMKVIGIDRYENIQIAPVKQKEGD